MGDKGFKMDEFDRLQQQILTSMTPGGVSETEELVETMVALVQRGGFERCWREILCDSSLALMQGRGFRLVSGHRTFSRFLSLYARVDDAVAGAFSRSEYLHVVMLALLRVVSSDEASAQSIANFSWLLPSLPLEAHAALLELLATCCRLDLATTDSDDRDECDSSNLKVSGIDHFVVMNAIPADWSLEASWLLLRLERKAHPSRPSKSTLPLFKSLLSRAVAGGTAVTLLVDTLLLKRSMGKEIAEAVMELLPADSLTEALDSIASVWGCRMFISRGDVDMQRYLTYAILFGLDRISGTSTSTALFSSGSSGVHLNLLFSSGISAYLDLSNSESRLLGMRVAMKVARLSGHQLYFDEVIEADGCNGDPSSPDSRRTDEGPVPALCLQSPLFPQCILEDDIEAEKCTASDTDSELEAFDFDGGEASMNASYLRNCLNLLRCHESDASSHDKHLRALVSIPGIVASGPIDARDLVGELTKELVRISNTFNIDKFDSLRGDAMLSLVVHYPTLTIPVFTCAIEGGAMLGCMLLCVHVLMRSAHALSGVPFETDRNASLETIDKVQADTSCSRHGVTRIKRPRMLARTLSKHKTFRNSFGPVALLAYQPLAFSLGRLSSQFTVGTGEDGDSIDSLLPAQLLLALAAFTTCAINTPDHKYMIDETLKLSQPLILAHSLSVRRAALSACLASIQAFNSYLEQMMSQTAMSQGPLDKLSTLTHSVMTHSGTNDSYRVTGLESFAPLVDLILSKIDSEADKVCRGLMSSVVRSALSQ